MNGRVKAEARCAFQQMQRAPEGKSRFGINERELGYWVCAVSLTVFGLCCGEQEV